jgi:hypothetical protein
MQLAHNLCLRKRILMRSLGSRDHDPAPGNGSGWIYFVSMLRAGLAANACRTVHGRAKQRCSCAVFQKISSGHFVIVSLLFHCTNAPPRITFYRRRFVLLAISELLPVILEIMKISPYERLCQKIERGRLHVFTGNAPRARLSSPTD